MRFPCKENRKKGLLVKPCVYLCVKDSLSHAEYFISRRDAENAKLASRFALAVGLPSVIHPDGNIRAIAMYASVFCASA